MKDYTWRFYGNRNDYSQLPRWILTPNGIGDSMATIELLEDGGFEIRVTHKLEDRDTLKSAKAAAEAFFEDHAP